MEISARVALLLLSTLAVVVTSRAVQNKRTVYRFPNYRKASVGVAKMMIDLMKRVRANSDFEAIAGRTEIRMNSISAQYQIINGRDLEPEERHRGVQVVWNESPPRRSHIIYGNSENSNNLRRRNNLKGNFLSKSFEKVLQDYDFLSGTTTESNPNENNITQFSQNATQDFDPLLGLTSEQLAMLPYVPMDNKEDTTTESDPNEQVSSTSTQKVPQDFEPLPYTTRQSSPKRTSFKEVIPNWRRNYFILPFMTTESNPNESNFTQSPQNVTQDFEPLPDTTTESNPNEQLSFTSTQKVPQDFEPLPDTTDTTTDSNLNEKLSSTSSQKSSENYSDHEFDPVDEEYIQSLLDSIRL